MKIFIATLLRLCANADSLLLMVPDATGKYHWSHKLPSFTELWSTEGLSPQACPSVNLPQRYTLTSCGARKQSIPCVPLKSKVFSGS